MKTESMRLFTTAQGPGPSLGWPPAAYPFKRAHGTRRNAPSVPLLDRARRMGTSLWMFKRHHAHYHPAPGASCMDRVSGADKVGGVVHV